MYECIINRMVNITETPEETEKPVQLVLNGKLTPLTKENVFAFLKIFIDRGFKSSKVLSIKEGAMLHHYFDLLTKQEKRGTLDPEFPEIYKVVLKAIEVSHNDGAFDTSDAAVMDKLFTFIEKNFSHLFEKGVTATEKVTV